MKSINQIDKNGVLIHVGDKILYQDTIGIVEINPVYKEPEINVVDHFYFTVPKWEESEVIQ